MLILIYCISVLVFSFVLLKIKVISDCLRVIKLSRESIEIMQTANLTDDEKESKIQNNAISLLKFSVLISGKLICIGVVSFLPGSIAEYSGVLSIHDLALFALRVDVILYTTIILLVYFKVSKVIKAISD